MYECAAAVAAFQGSIPLTATAGHHGAQTAEMALQKSKWVQTNTAKELLPNQTAEIVFGSIAASGLSNCRWKHWL